MVSQKIVNVDRLEIGKVGLLAVHISIVKTQRSVCRVHSGGDKINNVQLLSHFSRTQSRVQRYEDRLIVAFDEMPVHRINYRLLHLPIFVTRSRVSCIILSAGKCFFNYLCILYIYHTTGRLCDLFRKQ